VSHVAAAPLHRLSVPRQATFQTWLVPGAAPPPLGH
jgi:hypothetical protein